MAFIDPFQERFEAEILSPLKRQSEEKVKFAQQYFPNLKPVHVLVGFWVFGFLLSKMLAPARATIEMRLERAAERLIPKKKRRRR